MENAQIAAMFDEIAELLELQGENTFRIRSYYNAARTIRDMSHRLSDLVRNGEDLTNYPNIGKGTAERIQEIVETGTCKTLQEAREHMPAHLIDLLRLPALGPKKVKQLHDALGIANLEELQKACEEHRVRDLKGFGERTEEKILKGIEFLATVAGRTLLKEAEEHALALGHYLESLNSVRHWQLAGSFRRVQETIGDLDILVEAKDRDLALKEIAAYNNIEEILSQGAEKISVRLFGGLQVDFRFFEHDAFGAALMYFTGSKSHNIILRQRAQKRNWKLSEYGLFKDETRLAGATEAEIYEKLGMQWIPPELREGRGEVEAAEAGELPQLVEVADIKGDLHCHTKASDGLNTIQEMIAAAKERGYQYIAITDHSKAVAIANGLDEVRMTEHAEEIRAIGKGEKDFRVLTGIEVDIMKDGSLDLDVELLAQLDWVVASIHSFFGMEAPVLTERIVKALDSGLVHCLGHPFGRVIAQREPLQFDAEKVFEACARNNVCLEINAHPDRLDLMDIHCRRAKDMGVHFAIGTDAHKQMDYKFIKFGVGVARRGWLEPADIVNTRSREGLEEWLKMHKRKRGS